MKITYPKHYLPEIPSDLQVCFTEVTQFPAGTNLTSEQAVRLIIELRQSELDKTLCGRRLIAWYESLKGSNK